MAEVPAIPGVEDVIAWFGYWPSFHDAEVVSIHLDRASGCRVVVEVFRGTSTTDEQGALRVPQACLVTFLLEGFPMDASGIVNSRIEFFNHQNVLRGLEINRVPEGYELVLDGIFGVAGTLMASRVAVELKPVESSEVG